MPLRFGPAAPDASGTPWPVPKDIRAYTATLDHADIITETI